MVFSSTTLLIILLILVVLSAFFSGSEIGMMSLNRYRLRHLVKQGHAAAKQVQTLLTRPDKLLSVILIGNTLANIVASMVATLLAQRFYGDLGVAIATLLLTFVILVFSEMTPKTLAALHPQEVAFFSVWPLKILGYVLTPLVWLTTAIANLILSLFGVTMEHGQKESLSGEELRSVVHEAGVLLPIEHKSMIISLLDLEQATVEDIMVPKSEITGIDITKSWQDILDELETAQHTRLPLYQGDIEHIVGVIHVRSIMNLLLEDELDLSALMERAEKPYFIPEGTTLDMQLLNFRKMKKRSCFVVDEYGDLQGLVTMEDILEEVVGEFTTDIAALSRDVMPEEDGSWIIDASITVRQLNRLMKWQLPLLGPRTLSGMLIEYLGYIPPADVCLLVNGYQIEVLKVGENTIKSVRVLKRNKPHQIVVSS